MYIGDVNFGYNYTDPVSCKAEFSVYGSFGEISELRANMPINRYNYLTATNYNLIKTPMITKVIFHDPATIVYWQDKTKTVVKCKDGETFDKEKGLAMCISKKLLGDEFHSEFRKYTEDKEAE